MARTTTLSTQQFLPFADVREGLVILKDGSFRAVAMVTAINFALKSDKEQNAIIFRYQNFLNSLSFPVQIVMQSKRLDLTAYLKQLQNLEEKESNELLRVQINDYRIFITKLITVANIMDKRFYVVVPYVSMGLKQATPVIPGTKNKGPVRISETQFKVAQQELSQHLITIQNGLGGIGLGVVPLNTQQLVELLYTTYNPEEAEVQKLDDVENLQGTAVSLHPDARIPQAGAGAAVAPFAPTTPTTPAAAAQKTAPAPAPAQAPSSAPDAASVNPPPASPEEAPAQKTSSPAPAPSAPPQQPQSTPNPPQTKPVEESTEQQQTPAALKTDGPLVTLDELKD